MSEELATLVETKKVSILTTTGKRFGIDPRIVSQTLKKTAFKLQNGEVSDEQMCSLLVVANQFKLNPFTREIFAFPDKGGIVPVVGIDGWSRIINDHTDFDGVSFEQDDESCTCTLYRKDRKHPTVVTEYASECRRDTKPWSTHPKRMLRHKALIQCARLAFGFVGIFDQDEAERIRERDVTEETEVVEEPKEKKVESVVAEKPVEDEPEDAVEVQPAAPEEEKTVNIDTQETKPLTDSEEGRIALMANKKATWQDRLNACTTTVEVKALAPEANEIADTELKAKVIAYGKARFATLSKGEAEL